MDGLLAEPAGVPSRRIAKLFGVTTKTIASWANLGILRPGGHGRYSFDSLDVLACAVARDLRARGFGLDQCRVVADWLRSKGLADLQAEWGRGQRYLLSVGAAPPFHRQWTYAEIFENDAVDLPGAFAMGLPVAVIDLRQAFEQLAEKLAGVRE